jgi:hypothetical protein
LAFDTPCHCSQPEGPGSLGCGEELRVGQTRLGGRELAWEHDCEERHGGFEATGGCVVCLALQGLESCQPALVKKELVSRGEEDEQLSHTHVGVLLEHLRSRECLLHVGLLSRMGRADGTAGRETSFCREESCSQRGLQGSYGSGNVSKFFSFILSFSSRRAKRTAELSGPLAVVCCASRSQSSRPTSRLHTALPLDNT